MNYAEIKKNDIANGEGVRVSLFVSGCTHHCHNCFNPETWSFSYGSPFDEQAQSKLLTMLSPDYIDGLSLLGGEPFEPDNQRVLLPFLQKVKARYPQKTIWAFSLPGKVAPITAGNIICQTIINMIRSIA